MPDGFREAVLEVQAMLNSIEDINLYFNNSIKTNILISYIADNRLKKERINKIELNNTSVNIHSNNYFREEEQSYYNEEIYEKVIKLIDERKEHMKNKHNEIKLICDNINNFIENKFNTILVKTRLMQND